GMPPAFYNDLGSGAHIAWSDTNKCSEEANNNRFTICYSHVLTGQVDVEFQDGETFYHVIEPGEQTIYNMSMNNSTPGPKDLVADTFGLNISGVPQNWTATLFFADNHTTIMPDTAIFLEGGEDIRFYIRIRAPSVYQADADQLADITVTAKSYKDPAIQSDIITRTLMDVVHGINLDTSHSMADVEQGQTAIFSITITNTGNVNDRFIFWDPYTLEGQQEWLLPFNWAVVFPTSVELDPGQSVTKNLEVLVPTSEDPGAFVIYLKGWSEGEPIKSIEKGTYDVLELGVFVSIRSTGNIVMEIFDTSEYVDPGKCATYPIDVTKNFDSGSLVFVTPGAPDVKPDTISMDAWRTDNWVLNLDFSNAPGGNSIEMSEPRAWTLPPGAESVTYEVSVEVCAPTGASAGLGPAVILKAYLEGYPRISASKILSTNVNHVYQLHADVDLDEDDKITLNGQEVLPVNPGQQISLSTTVTNLGNGPDRFDYRLARVTDPTGVDVIWDIDVPRETLKELSRDTDQIFEITMNVPDQVEAGVYMVVFQTFSEESYPDSSGRLTRLRATLELPVYVQEFYDMQISMDSTVDNAIKTSAPGRIVRFELNITNNGNVPDWPTLNNHTANRDGEALIWTELPGMGTLGGWSVEWRLVKQIGTDLTTEEMCETVASLDVTTGDEDAAIDPATAFADLSERCVYLESDDRYFMPMMDPYTTYPVVAIVKIAPTAKLDTRSIGLKVVSKMGNMLEGGDHDDSPSWAAENLDTNEFVVTLRLRAPNLVISEVTASDFSGDVDTTIPIRVVLQNDGNTHATDIEIVLCEYPDSDDDTLAEIRLNGCDDENIVMRHMIGALLAPDASEDYKEIELVLLYPVSAGSHGVYVVVDPSNSIVETNEKDNIMGVEDELKSSGGVLDVASEVIGKTALPFAVILLTLALFGVVYLVGRGRRQDVLDRKAEQSSLVSVLAGNDL
ncbi:MAG: putative membrane protein, partial [Candidatus Poseidoniaceae archaeon]